MPSTYLTKSGFERLFGELEFLKRVKRQEIAYSLRDSNGGNDSVVASDCLPDGFLAELIEHDLET